MTRVATLDRIEPEDAASARALLQEVLEAHGGLRRWRELAAIRARMRCGGLALWSRGQPRAFEATEVVISSREPWAVFTPFHGGRGYFRADRVWHEPRRGAVAGRDQPRRLLPGLRRSFVWDRLDVLYFGGYAIWNYLCTPFLLARPEVELRELPAVVVEGERWRRLWARFPDALPTHSREQVFYIDGRGYVRRHDYTADVIGRYAVAAHLCERHRAFGGLIFPTRRRVHPRLPNGRWLPFPTLIRIDLDEVEPLTDAPDSD